MLSSRNFNFLVICRTRDDSYVFDPWNLSSDSRSFASVGLRTVVSLAERVNFDDNSFIIGRRYLEQFSSIEDMYFNSTLRG